MVEEFIKTLTGKLWVTGGESGNEVIFECLDAAFSSVSTVHACRSELKVDVLLCEETFESAGAFVVEHLEAGTETSVCEKHVEFFVGSENFRASAVSESASEDGIAVVVVEYDEVLCSFGGEKRESSSLVGVDFAVWFIEDEMSVHKMGA